MGRAITVGNKMCVMNKHRKMYSRRNIAPMFLLYTCCTSPYIVMVARLQLTPNCCSNNSNAPTVIRPAQTRRRPYKMAATDFFSL